MSNRAIFAWPLKWKRANKTEKNEWTEIERFDWFIERIQTRAAFGWLSERLAEKTSCPKNFLKLNQYFALTSYCNTTGQSNNAFSILGFFLAGKRRVHVLIRFHHRHWLIKQITNPYRNHFSRSYENRSIQFIKPVAFSSFIVADPWRRGRRGSHPNISITQLLWNWNNYYITCLHF